MLVPSSNQLSYEATDRQSWLFGGSNVPVMNELMAVMILSVMTAIFCNCVEKPEKFGTSLRPFTRTCRFNAFSMKAMKEFSVMLKA